MHRRQLVRAGFVGLTIAVLALPSMRAAAAGPEVSVASSTLVPGAVTTVTAAGFGAREHVRIDLGTRRLALATTDKQGSLAAVVDLPLTVALGPQQLSVVAASGERAAVAVTIVALPGRCGGTSCEPLARTGLAETGVSTGELVLTAIVLLLGGATLWIAGISTADAEPERLPL